MISLHEYGAAAVTAIGRLPSVKQAGMRMSATVTADAGACCAVAGQVTLTMQDCVFFSNKLVSEPSPMGVSLNKLRLFRVSSP